MPHREVVHKQSDTFGFQFVENALVIDGFGKIRVLRYFNAERAGRKVGVAHELNEPSSEFVIHKQVEIKVDRNFKIGLRLLQAFEVCYRAAYYLLRKFFEQVVFERYRNDERRI